MRLQAMSPLRVRVALEWERYPSGVAAGTQRDVRRPRALSYGRAARHRPMAPRCPHLTASHQTPSTIEREQLGEGERARAARRSTALRGCSKTSFARRGHNGLGALPPAQRIAFPASSPLTLPRRGAVAAARFRVPKSLAFHTSLTPDSTVIPHRASKAAASQPSGISGSKSVCDS